MLAQIIVWILIAYATASGVLLARQYEKNADRYERGVVFSGSLVALLQVVGLVYVGLSLR